MQFGRLELKLGLAVAHQYSVRRPESSFVQSVAEPFHEKLNLALELAELLYASNPQAQAAWHTFYMLSDSLRELRNHLVHARWGVIQRQQKVASVLCVKSTGAQQEQLLSINDLRRKVRDVQAVSTLLNDLTRKWPLVSSFSAP